MAILRPAKFLFTIFLILTFNNFLFSQKLDPKKRGLEPNHTITSKITERDYQLYISLPLYYSTKDTITYPILYVMDGKRDFDFFNMPNILLSISDRTEEVIIVGIDSGIELNTRGINRTYDYTPTPNNDTTAVRENEKRRNVPAGTIKSGGAAKFLEVIKTEVAPFVDKHYKTNTDRGISGHSLGGLFTAYCFINSDGYFTRFGINSPSLWWNENELLKQAVSQFSKNKTWDLPPTQVFISVGKKESKRMIPNMAKFSSYLQDAKYENIDLSWHIFENETHASVIPISLRKTIIELYKK